MCLGMLHTSTSTCCFYHQEGVTEGSAKHLHMKQGSRNCPVTAPLPHMSSARLNGLLQGNGTSTKHTHQWRAAVCLMNITSHYPTFDFAAAGFRLCGLNLRVTNPKQTTDVHLQPYLRNHPSLVGTQRAPSRCLVTRLASTPKQKRREMGETLLAYAKEEGRCLVYRYAHYGIRFNQQSGSANSKQSWSRPWLQICQLHLICSDYAHMSPKEPRDVPAATTSLSAIGLHTRS